MTGSARARVVLAVDYPGRRPEARIQDLKLEADGWDVHYLVTEPLGRELTAEDYAAALLERHQPPADAVALLAYCTGGPIAQHIAVRLAARRTTGPMPMVLFDGAPSRPALIARDLRTAAAQVEGATAGRAPVDAADRLGHEALTDDRSATFAWMRDLLAGYAADALRADGADDDEATEAAGEICAVYLDWLAYLVAGYNTDHPAWGGDLLHLVSVRHIFVEPWPGCGDQRLVRLPAGADDLLATDEARRLTTAFLDERTTR